MSLRIAERLGSRAAHTGLFYFSLFMVQGVANPFLPIWLSDQGISEQEIGSINALPILIMVLLNLAIGRLADRASDWRQVIVVGALIGVIPPIALYFVHGYWPILILWAMVVIPFQAIAPVADAATIRMVRRRGGDFGAIRSWGTIGFIAATVTSGFILDGFGPGVFVPIVIVVSLLRAVLSLQLPYFRAGEPDRPPSRSEPLAEFHPPSPLMATRMREIWHPWFMLAMVGTALVNASHMMQMSFGALMWKEQGISGAIIGPLWAVAPVGEVFVMLFFKRLATRFSARHLLLAAAVFALVRWVGFALQPPIWGYALLQFLHLGSFALAYMGIVNFIANWTTEDIAAQAQSAFVMIRQIATVIALSGFGFIVAGMGNNAYFVAAAVAAVGGMLIFASLRLMNPKREQDEQAAASA